MDFPCQQAGDNWLAAQEAAHTTFIQNQTREMKMSHLQLNQLLLPIQRNWSRFQALLLESIQDGDSAGTTIMEERGSESYPSEEETKGLPQSSPEESTGLVSVFSLLSFPQKLWVLVESDHVRSIWWDHRGNCLNQGINVYGGSSGKGKHLREHLGESFVHQLNLYRFTRVPRYFGRSPSLLEFLAKE